MARSDADFGWETDQYSEVQRENSARMFNESERRMRAIGRFEAAVRYQNIADAITRGYVRSWHGWDMVALYMGGRGTVL